MKLLSCISLACKLKIPNCCRFLTQSFTGVRTTELSHDLKINIESYWRKYFKDDKFDKTNLEKKFYVLSMFPYPSGKLHMGHVRVYTISDSIARFHRMCGKNVFHPIGWDAFGLPAENAAIQRGMDAKTWTNENIEEMRSQLKNLGCSFDWQYELSTCNPDYYKWTQLLFLMLYREGLVYRNEALVNWDPIDCTVLADEQVDNNGYSWRSGAKVEKKLLKQWFIKTTTFAQQLLNGLDDPMLVDWRDIINLQRHWIGECDGYAFNLLTSSSNYIRVWTPFPEHFSDPNAFVVLRTKHYLNNAMNDIMHMTIENPFTGKLMPIVFNDAPMFADNCDVYLAAPNFREIDKTLCNILPSNYISDSTTMDTTNMSIENLRAEIVATARRLKIGGYKVSSKLQDWLISRQRYWGTPIPVIHCYKCGTIPVLESQLPVYLPDKSLLESNRSDALRSTCPKCGNLNAQREIDTMDTFVDSCWYYLRYPDVHNSKMIFDSKIIQACMPVNLYIGGKEHAVLHLYYARFINHFLHSQGLVPTSEPFSRLLVQGMVMGRSYRIKSSGRYVLENDVHIVNSKKGKAVLKSTNEEVIMAWEKMSKSKMNGVDPSDMLKEYGTDTTRLIILADVAPTSHRNWTNETFPGILNWQKRLWLTVNEFCDLRSSTESKSSIIDVNSDEFLTEDAKLNDARNYYVKGVTFNFRHTHQLSVAISKMQGLTNSLRRASKQIICYGKEYERALAAQLIMLAPIAPHFASELWSKFSSVQHLNIDSNEFKWDQDVLMQSWPDIDMQYKLDLTIKINGYENCAIKIARSHIDFITHNDAMDMAFSTDTVTSYLIDKKIRTTNFVLYPGIEAILSILVDKVKQQKRTSDTGNTKNNKEVMH